jgi:hypothetical protein
VRYATRWVLAFLAVATAATAFVGQGGGETSHSQPTALIQSASRAYLIARVEPSKPISKMTLAGLARFRERALRVYVSRWRLWQTDRSRLIEDVVRPLSTCRGAHAPRWACWNLQASIWQRGKLKQIRTEIRLQQMVNYDFNTALKYVQRVFPGTYDWGWSCTDAEGGHGRWVPHNSYGDHYYPGYERLDAVGGWFQFRPSTFNAYIERAVFAARARGLEVPAFGPDVRSWLNPLAQALTGAYMRWAGLDGSHWQASWGKGCR